ncbi:hypothetical protein J1N35_022301 [Gossypium stocksii]|uniref:Uncharacterized protein n=1 Tax=Gossypium stocksii TaxID=47602 RepID=A0A9D4A2U4_9ROSI|nr:hypothetical protein J1N35_022301 [Gossypium stocksii]
MGDWVQCDAFGLLFVSRYSIAIVSNLTATAVFTLTAGVKSMELAFNPTIKLCELRTRIRRKVRGSTQGRILKLKCRFFAYKYELFDVIGKVHLETIISSHYSSRNVVMKLHVEFTEANRSDPFSTTIVANMRTEAKEESSTTQLCGGFTSILQSNYYDVPKISMGKHLLVSGDNEGTNEEEDVAYEERTDEEERVAKEKDSDEEERATDIINAKKSNPKPIRQCSLDGSKVVLFFKSEPEPYEFEDDASNNASNSNP